MELEVGKLYEIRMYVASETDIMVNFITLDHNVYHAKIISYSKSYCERDSRVYMWIETFYDIYTFRKKGAYTWELLKIERSEV